MVPGDLFESVPAGGDVYILKRILMDKDDEAALEVLANVREAMSASATLLIGDPEKLMPLSQVIRFRPPLWVCRRPDACRWRSCFGPFPPFFRALPPDYVATTSLMPEEPGTTG